MKNLVLLAALVLGFVGTILLAFGNGVGITMLFPLVIWSSITLENISVKA
jgi:hypothetical protein